MDALGQGYRNGGGLSRFVSAAFGVAAGVLFVKMLGDDADYRAQGGEGTDYLVYAECYAANLAAGVPEDVADPLAWSQASYLTCVATRRKLWWRLPALGALRGVIVYMMWFFISFVMMLLLRAQDNPTVDDIITFGFNHWEISLALGVLWAWFVLHRGAQLPFVPLTGGRLQRPWFPGDPSPVPGRDSVGGNPAPAPSEPGADAAAAAWLGQSDDHGFADTAVAPDYRHHEDALAALAKVEPDLRLILARYQRFLDDAGEHDTPRARRLTDIRSTIEPDFQQVRAALFAHDTDTAVRILTDRIHPVTSQLEAMFGHEDV